MASDKAISKLYADGKKLSKWGLQIEAYAQALGATGILFGGINHPNISAKASLGWIEHMPYQRATNITNAQNTLDLTAHNASVAAARTNNDQTEKHIRVQIDQRDL
jgi:tRNA G18 (ribose-2'-O)-methylase SpoU